METLWPQELKRTAAQLLLKLKTRVGSKLSCTFRSFAYISLYSCGISDLLRTQLQASSPTPHDAVEHERNEAEPSSEAQNTCTCLRRLSSLSLSLYTVFHLGYPCKWSSSMEFGRARHPVRFESPKWLGRSTTDANEECRSIRKAGTRYRRGESKDSLCDGGRGQSACVCSQWFGSRCSFRAVWHPTCWPRFNSLFLIESL